MTALPPPPPLGRGAVATGRRAVEPGVELPLLVTGGVVTATVDVVVSGTVDSDGDGPVARSRWLPLPPLPHAAAVNAKTERTAATLRRTQQTVPTMTQ